MKKAVAQLEEIPRQDRGLHEGHGRAGERSSATVHDIGQVAGQQRSSRTTATRVHRPRQGRWPIQTIVTTPAQGARGDGDRPSRRCSCSDLQSRLPACIEELHAKGPLIPGADRAAPRSTAAFSYRALYPGGKESEEVYEPGVFYCKDRLRGPVGGWTS